MGHLSILGHKQTGFRALLRDACCIYQKYYWNCYRTIIGAIENNSFVRLGPYLYISGAYLYFQLGHSSICISSLLNNMVSEPRLDPSKF
jgi:hypothetical protein